MTQDLLTSYVGREAARRILGGEIMLGRGMRIDLLMCSASVVDRATWSAIDRNARKGKQPSDHAPVIVDLAD